MKKTLFIITTSCLAACQPLSDIASTVNSTLGQVNSALSGGLIYVDDNTQQSIDAALKKAVVPKNARSAFKQATPRIKKVLGLIACDATTSQVKPYFDKTWTYVQPTLNMNYHRSGCLNIQSIHSIKMSAANALYFKVRYISPSSEEGASRIYNVIKQPDGEWLFEERQF